MNTKQNPSAVLAAMALLGSPVAVHAAELGFYVGGQYGNSSKDDNTQLAAVTLSVYTDLNYVPDQRSNRLDTEDTIWGFFAGYRLLPNLAFEAGYLTLGKERLLETSSGTFFRPPPNPGVFPESWTMSVGVRTSGFALSALGVLPITYNWEVYGRGGVFFGQNTISAYGINNEGVPVAGQNDKSSTDFLVGVGAGYTLAEVYQLRAEYQRIFDAGTKDYGEADVDLVTIGITVKF